MVVIELGQVLRQEDAAKFVQAIHGRSYMDFEVITAPNGGGYMVSATTTYTSDRHEARDMLMWLMFQTICKA